MKTTPTVGECVSDSIKELSKASDHISLLRYLFIHERDREKLVLARLSLDRLPGCYRIVTFKGDDPVMPELDFSQLSNRGWILDDVVDLSNLAGACQRCDTEFC